MKKIRIPKRKIEKFKIPHVALKRASERAMPPPPPRENVLDQIMKEIEVVRRNLHHVNFSDEIIVIDDD